MSDYLAVAGVSAVLRWLLTSNLTSGGPSVILGSSPGVTANSPDLVPIGANEVPRINLFMYYASLNPALRNMGLPSKNAQGGRTANEPLALNLHYLVSAYGSNQFDPEILLAWAMKVFHDTPVIPRATIQEALTSLATGDAASQLVATSTLANQVEHIRITPEALTTEEIYRLWTAFQTSYRPTTSYQISVVLIQDTQAVSSGLPVQRRTVSVLPSGAPTIDTITPSIVDVGGPPITLTGRNFVGDSPANTLVSFDGAPGVAPATTQGTALRVVVPATLQAGTRSLRVVRTLTPPHSSVPHAGCTSSPVPFQLRPAVQTPTPIVVKQGTTLTLAVAPSVGSTQVVALYIGDYAIPIDERPTTAPPSSPTLSFPVPVSIPPGTYPLAVEVDGARSPLTVDSVASSPTFGQMLPQVQVTT